MSDKTARDSIRSKIFSGKNKRRTKRVEVWGAEVEVRQPSLGAILSMQDNPDVKHRTANMIIEYTFVPGTDEHVFDSTDRDEILNWPFGADLLALQNAISELTGIDVAKAEEELKTDPLKE